MNDHWWTWITWHQVKPFAEGGWLFVWFFWVLSHTMKHMNTYKKMFEWKEPNKWPPMVRHTKLAYCEECDPPPQPHPGEIMDCPKCGQVMAHNKSFRSENTDLNTVKWETIETKDWFCTNCQEIWPDEAARKFQTSWHKEEAKRQRKQLESAAEAAEAAGFHQAGANGWTSYKFHPEQNTRYRPSLIADYGGQSAQYYPYTSPDLIKALSGPVAGIGEAERIWEK